MLEEIEKEYDENFIGTTSISMCVDGIGASEENYIIMPADGDIELYRNKLIKSMITNKQIKIKMANNVISHLINMI